MICALRAREHANDGVHFLWLPTTTPTVPTGLTTNFASRVPHSKLSRRCPGSVRFRSRFPFPNFALLDDQPTSTHKLSQNCTSLPVHPLSYIVDFPRRISHPKLGESSYCTHTFSSQRCAAENLTTFFGRAIVLSIIVRSDRNVVRVVRVPHTPWVAHVTEQ